MVCILNSINHRNGIPVMNVITPLSARSPLIFGMFFSLILTIPEALAQGAATDFSHKDWDLVCDNTLTCRAAGYSPESEEFGVTVLLTRKAGAATPVENEVMFGELLDGADNKPRGTPTLLIDNHPQGALQRASEQDDTWRMTEAQLTAFLRALRGDSQIRFKDQLATYSLSAAGSSAVLLKMDDVQGRLETRGAIFKKGAKDDTGVKAAIAAPTIVKAAVKDKESRDMTEQERAFFKPRLLKTLAASNNNDCDRERLNDANQPWQIARLDDNHSLIVASCWMAAYNEGAMFWLVDNEMKLPAQPITDRASYYAEGEITLAMKGRGLGDCWSYETWVWEGTTFVHSSESTTGRCRLIRAGGSWDMPTLVSMVIQP